jgi:acyl carrier protein
MNNTPEEIKAKIKAFILEEFLPGESEEALTDSTELVTHGVLDSLSTLQLATFIEQEYPVKLQAHEVNIDYLNTLTDITDLIISKLKA